MGNRPQGGEMTAHEMPLPWRRESRLSARIGVILFFLFIAVISFGLGWGWGNIAGWMDGYHTAQTSISREIARGIKYGNTFWLGDKLQFRSLKNGSSGYVYIHELPKKEVDKNGSK